MPNLTTKLTTYYPNTQLYILEKRQNGKRVNTVLVYNATGQKINELVYDDNNFDQIYYWRNGLRHNEHGPAFISWFINGQIFQIEYLQNDDYHNLHGPAILLIDINGQISYIYYRQNGILHNDHGPAYIACCNSQIHILEYWRNGFKHNDHGPACMHWHENEKIFYLEYWRNGATWY